MNKAIFLDKDWTLVDNSMYPLVPTDDILPWVIEWLKWINDNTDYLLFIVSNQSFINKWQMTQEETESVFKALSFKLRQNWIKIDWYTYCPHISSEKCDCRKPKTTMVEELARKYNIIIPESFVVWDSLVDQRLAQNLWTKFIAVRNKFTTDPPDFEDTCVTLAIDNFRELIKTNIF